MGSEGKLHDLRKKYGKVFSVKIGSFKVVIAGDTASVKELLVRKSADYAGRPPLYSFLRSTFDGKDIAVGNYSPAWKFHRKIFVAAIRRYLSDKQVVEKTIAEQATKLTQYFEDQNLKDFDPANMLMESIANVSCRILFGKRFDSSHSDFKELLKLNDDFFSDYEINTQRFILDFFPVAKYFPFRAYQLMNNMLDQVYEILRRQLKIQERESSNSTEIDSLTGSFLQERAVAENEVGAEERVAFLSDEYMLSNMRDMFVAGYDTTSSTLRWAIAFLVHHPKIQKEVQNQLDEVVGKDRVPNLDDLPNLPLVQAMIMETQRLGNVAENTIPHYTLKDTTLAGFRIPKDTIVFATLAQVHLDPGCWENPYSFNPHRHIDADGQLITNTGNFLPFSAGRRVCAGEALAKVRERC
ncbi:Steroid 17-alpha-hydroxylase/17,20 lyase [Stylophora pistillata]|uniref:Steroid 21-hydroxylase n=1 Tax=Stylophora pistillata TaxID=50429 RepID=A0A2B4S8W3_STYPI|nr:Steroid 17-alpha-hydroxylase/17,20 lyase [Stylophora pistillata]